MTFSEDKIRCMSRALELAARGQGAVEPNPMVGCVIAQESEIVGEGWHQQYGGPHAEVEAFRDAGDSAKGATLYVTLEPCCHHGKTPPCTEAIIEAGVRRVVVAQRDPFPKVDGGGIRQLEAVGIQVATGLLEREARSLGRPYFKLTESGRPWVIAKWAMSLDGRLATRPGESPWISGAASRPVVHQLRGRMDAILVGRRTAEIDDPLLTARPKGPRDATRIVIDPRAKLSLRSQLVQTAAQVPVLVAAGTAATKEAIQRLDDAGCEVFVCPGETHAARLGELLDELGRRRMTNVLVEGGATVLDGFLQAGAIDEARIFMAPTLIGGTEPVPEISQLGFDLMSAGERAPQTTIEPLGADLYLRAVLSGI